MTDKGFSVAIDGLIVRRGISTIADAIYLLKRYYIVGPWVEGHYIAQVLINNSVVYEYNMITQEEKHKMPRLSEINASTAKDTSGLPFLDGKANKEKGYSAGPGKEWLVASSLPFYVSNPRIKESSNDNFPDQIQYDITFFDGPDFAYNKKRFDIETGYILALPYNDERKQQMMAFDAEYQANPYLVVLKKYGRYFKLEEFEDETLL